jgi:hypothetical protein
MGTKIERLEQQVKDRDGEIRGLKEKLKGFQMQAAIDRDLRAKAQNGLIFRLGRPCVACGQKWWDPEKDGEIGYRPDRDPDMIEAIQADPRFTTPKAMA